MTKWLQKMIRVVLVDKKILGGGVAMLAVGLVLLAIINSSVPVGKSGMTEDEIIELMIQEEENKNMNTLASILTGVGFLLILISFGARRKSAGSAKKEEKKPTT
jgi:dolichol kinase